MRPRPLGGLEGHLIAKTMTWSIRVYEQNKYPLEMDKYYVYKDRVRGSKYIQILSIEVAKDNSCVFVYYVSSRGQSDSFIYGSYFHQRLKRVSKLTWMVKGPMGKQ